MEAVVASGDMNGIGSERVVSHSNRILTKKVSSTASFRLRCPSLNSLRLRRIFDLFDKNSDGIITLDELSNALNILGLDADLSDLHSTITSFIQPGNIGLTFQDFSSLHQSLNNTFFAFDDPLIEEEEEEENTESSNGFDEEVEAKKRKQEESDLSEAFKVFDEDGDGYISAKELQVVLRKLGLSEGNEMDMVQRMIISVDLNQDGRVDFFEFKDMMRSIIVPPATS